jgi:hypothetical protein
MKIDLKNSPKADNRVGGCIVPAIVFGLAKLADTDRRQADVATTREPKEQSINHQQGHAASGGKP